MPLPLRMQLDVQAGEEGVSKVMEFVRLLVRYVNGGEPESFIPDKFLCDVVEALDRMDPEMRERAVEYLREEGGIPSCVIRKR